MEYLSLPGVLIQLWVFGLGLVIGSFLNVCICRIPENLSLLWPASKCVNCSKRIVWYDNIPVLSYLFLRGKTAKTIGFKLGKVQEEELIATLRTYKRERTRENFNEILGLYKLHNI